MSAIKVISKQRSARLHNNIKGVLAQCECNMAKKHKEYFINKTKVPGVTTVLNIIHKEGLEKWKQAMGHEAAQRMLVQAGNFGTEVHELIEHYFTTGQIKKSDDEDINLAIRNLVKWSDKNVKKWLGFEKGVYNDKEMYAGTVDAYAQLKSGKIVIVDFKTAKSVHDEYFLQLSAYYNCTSIEDKPVDPKKIKGAIILHLNRKSYDWDVYQVTDLAMHYKTFIAALRVWNWVNNRNALLLQEKQRTRTNRVTTKRVG